MKDLREKRPGGFNRLESFLPLPPWSCLIWCAFVMHFRQDSYHLKPCNPVRIMFALVEPPLRGNVRFANVMRACWASSTVSVTLKLFNHASTEQETSVASQGVVTQIT
jgi:hypothetical protein